MTRKGLIGSFLHVVTAEEANYLQKLAQQSRYGRVTLTKEGEANARTTWRAHRLRLRHQEHR